MSTTDDRLALLLAIQNAADAGLHHFAAALRKVYHEQFGHKPRLGDIKKLMGKNTA